MATTQDIRAALTMSGGDRAEALRILRQQFGAEHAPDETRVEEIIRSIEIDTEEIKAHADAQTRDEQMLVFRQMLGMGEKFQMLAEAIEDDDDAA